MFCAFSSSLRGGGDGAACVPVKPSERGSFMSNTQKSPMCLWEIREQEDCVGALEETVHQWAGQKCASVSCGSDGIRWKRLSPEAGLNPAQQDFLKE